MRNYLEQLDRLCSRAIIWLIVGYQKNFSPDHGALKYFFGNNRCRFFPSCSEYALVSLSQYGLLRGLVVSLGRVLRCYPWSKGGYDPVRSRDRVSRETEKIYKVKLL